jgi:hypothetical protein
MDKYLQFYAQGQILSNPCVVQTIHLFAVEPIVDFWLLITETPDKDGSHATETVSWLVVEAGTWEVADGVRLRPKGVP